MHGDWPHTQRVLPWLVAGLLVMIWWVPFDVTTLPVPLPFDPKLDRGALLVCLGLWVLVLATRERGASVERHRFGGFELVLLAFLLACVASVAAHLPTLARLNEAEPAVKQLALLASYVALYLFVVCNVRRSEVPAFARLIVGLAVVTAVGTIVEYRTGFNVFYSATAAVSPPGVSVPPQSINVTPEGRPDITGPARHGLAVSTMLAMALPLALLGATTTRDRLRRGVYLLAALVIFVGCLATLRRSGVVLPLVTMLVVTVFGGRRMLPMAAVFVVLLLTTPLVAPGAVSDLRDQLAGRSAAAQESSRARTADYPAVVPDLRHRALLGRGWGTFDAVRYRFIDNQYLRLLIEVGAIGTLVYLGVVLAATATGLRLAVSRRERSSDALALGAALAGFLVAGVLFDVLAFPHVPYVFFFMAAFVLRSRPASPAVAT
jgi:O-antigen ligase